MAAGEEAVDVGLGVPVFVAVAWVAEEAVVAEAFQITVLDAEECHQGFVVVDVLFIVREEMGVLGLHKLENFVEEGFNAVHLWGVNGETSVAWSDDRFLNRLVACLIKYAVNYAVN